MSEPPLSLAAVRGVGGGMSVAVEYDSARGGLFVRTRGDDTVEARRLTPEGEPSGEPTSVEVPGAHDVRHLERSGDAFLVMSHDRCEEAEEAMCLHVRGIGADGSGIGEPMTVRTDERIGHWYVASADGVFALRSHDDLPPVVERFVVDEEGLTRTELVDWPGEVRTRHQAMGLAADGERWAALVGEFGRETRLVLYSPAAREGTPLPLPPTGSFELDFVEEGLRIVRAHSSDPPTLLVVRLDGTIVTPAREVDSDEVLGPRVVASIEGVSLEPERSLERRDVAGRVLGDAGPVFTVPAVGPVGLDGDGRAYVVVDGGGAQLTRPYRPRAGALYRLRCAMR